MGKPNSFKFTKTAIAAIEPSDKRLTFYDEELTGLLLRVSPAGHKSFYFWYRPGKGRGVEVKAVNLGTFPTMTVEQAREKARALSARVVNGQDPAQEINEDKEAATVAMGVERFIAEYVTAKLKKNSQLQYKLLANKHVVPAIGKMRLKDVDTSDIIKLHNSMKETPYAANRTLAFLSKFFNWCETVGLKDDNTNPVNSRRVTKNKEYKKTDFLDEADVEKIGHAIHRLEVAQGKPGEKSISPLAAAALRLLILTGARTMEILTLKWSYIDFERNLANLPDSKTGQKVIHLSAPALNVLDNMIKIEPGGYVFPTMGARKSASGHLESVKAAWALVCETAQLEKHWRVHDLRHAYASAAVNSGASLSMVGALLGHSRASTTQRYAHLSENPVHKLAEETASHLNELLNSQDDEGPGPEGAGQEKGKILQFKPRKAS